MGWHLFDTREQQAATLADVIAERLQQEINERGFASWAVSGGSTPAPLFRVMQTRPLPWQQVKIALVDERWVDSEHSRSNEAFVRTELCQGLAAAASLTGMKTPHADPYAAEAMVNERYQPLQPFSSVLLGMGADGHTASLFPEAEGLEAAFDSTQQKTCVALTARRSEVTGAEVQRMSLTARAIGAARQIVLMITGAEKRAVLEQAIQEHSGLPVTRLMEQAAIDIYWAP